MGSTPNCVSHILASPPSPPASRPISQATLAAIRSIPLVDIAGSVVKLRRAGRQLVGLCPFHSERTPSFRIDPEKNVFYCHGCGVGGDTINFIQRLEHCDFRQAVRMLGARFGVSIEDEPVDRQRLAWRDELRQIEQRIKQILHHEQLRCADELARLRHIQRTHDLNSMPADIYERQRAADVRFVLVNFLAEDDAIEFLCSAPANQAQRIDEVLQDGYVIGARRIFWEVPL